MITDPTEILTWQSLCQGIASLNEGNSSTSLTDTIIAFAIAFAPVASVGVAILAIFLSCWVEKRNRKRFNKQLKQAEKIAVANATPLLVIRSQVYEHKKGITLTNRGVGTAVITSMKFSRDGQDGVTTSNLVELFNLSEKFQWNTFLRFTGDRHYLAAGETFQLVKLTESALVKQGLSQEDARNLLQQWQTQKSGIQVCIEYQDVFGNAKEPCKDTLK